MDQLLIPALALFVVVGGGGVAVTLYRFYTQHRRLQSIWRRIADHFRLRYAEEAYGRIRSISGTVDEFPVLIESHELRRPGETSYASRIVTRFPTGLGLQLLAHRRKREGPPIGPDAQPVELGKQDFDLRFKLATSRPDSLKSFLTDELLERMLNYDSSIGALEVDDLGVTYREDGVIDNPARMIQVVDGQLWLVRALWARKGEVDVEVDRC